MPRTARLDAIGLMQHVFVRGIEKRDIFLDDEDRILFMKRFEKLLGETRTECYAWALMPNHFHLMLRPTQGKLSVFMRRLLTGHAITFNLRHQRVGHLFQNRYKSIVCEEEPYLLELVRYIHLNPLRAGIVKDLAQLGDYQWSGHAVLMGNRRLAGQVIAEVLSFFGGNGKDCSGYLEYITAGISQGHRDEFGGGGRRRSSMKLCYSESDDAFDERILGSGEFVSNILQTTKLREPMHRQMTLAELAALVAEEFGITMEALSSRNRSKQLADARSAVCYLAVRARGLNGEDVAKFLNITRSGVSIAAKRGECIARKKAGLLKIIER